MCFGIIMWFCGISKLTEGTIHEAVKFSHLYFYANNIFFVRIIQLLMIKPVIIIATIYCIYIILISYTAFNWTCVMENGDLDITFHMESFFWPVRFIASLIWKLLPNRVKLL